MIEISTHNMKCENCGADFETDGYIWVCECCRYPERLCECGSDDANLDWDIITDPNGELCPDPAWALICHMCERQTPYFLTAKEAAQYWKEHGGEFYMCDHKASKTIQKLPDGATIDRCDCGRECLTVTDFYGKRHEIQFTDSAPVTEAQ